MISIVRKDRRKTHNIYSPKRAGIDKAI